MFADRGLLPPANRDEQFRTINRRVETLLPAGNVVFVDRQQEGRSGGKFQESWTDMASARAAASRGEYHDFSRLAVGTVIPYGDV